MMGVPDLPAELLPPQIERGVGKSVLSAQFLDRRARRCLLQEANDLLVGEPLLHVRPLW